MKRFYRTLLFLAAAGLRAQPAPADPYLWLEEVSSPRAMAWVKSENEKSTTVLEKDPRFGGRYQQALAIAEAKDRIPAPEFVAGRIFNFWQDREHIRGIWRTTTLESYRWAAPEWSTLLDLDELAKNEHANWVLHGTAFAEPAETRCLLSLSDGGEDAVTVREFDTVSRQFVADGFVLPHGKQRVAWENPDTLLVAREWTPGLLTTSGYPFVVKRLRRGQPPEQAEEIFRGQPQDGGYGVLPIALHDGTGHQLMIIQRPLSTFESEKYVVGPAGVAKLALPPKCTIDGLLHGFLLVTLAEDWSAGGGQFPSGSLIALDGAQLAHNPSNIQPALVYVPGARESLGEVAVSRDGLLVTILDNVRGRARLYRAPETGASWSSRPIDLPDNLTVDIVDADEHQNRAFLRAAGFLLPSSLYFVDTASGALSQTKVSPARFDASGDEVEQRQATSKDGTRIPYFVVHPKNLKLDGSNPTIIDAYGGFNVSETPFYSGAIGKLWLESGGTFVLANIRGGGEFGPAWHDAGLKTHRQRIYDDFAAVAEDLIARKVTSPRRLGIEGGSNGGLLMGVEFTQHPELWKAVDIQVPLLDMVRYEKIAAGSSWVGEYGSMSNPAEAAFLTSISPYAQVKRGVHYPEPFIWTTTKDDRVGPQHARKFAARLSEYGIPYLFYEVTEGGHGSGANLKERAHTTALEFTYFAQKLMN